MIIVIPLASKCPHSRTGVPLPLPPKDYLDPTGGIPKCSVAQGLTWKLTPSPIYYSGSCSPEIIDVSNRLSNTGLGSAMHVPQVDFGAMVRTMGWIAWINPAKVQLVADYDLPPSAYISIRPCPLPRILKGEALLK